MFWEYSKNVRLMEKFAIVYIQGESTEICMIREVEEKVSKIFEEKTEKGG